MVSRQRPRLEQSDRTKIDGSVFKNGFMNGSAGTTNNPLIVPGATSNKQYTGKFHVDDDGVWVEILKKGGITAWVRICSRLDVVAETRNETGNEWGKLLIWNDLDGCKHEWPMPMRLIGQKGGPVIAALRDGGVNVEPHGENLVPLYIQLQRPARRIRLTSRTGWHGKSYVLPGITLGPDGAEEIVFRSITEPERTSTVQGTAEEWRERVGRYCPGNSRLLAAVSTAFAGPALKLTNDESGGLHLNGITSAGKTTTAEVAASVTGDKIEQWLATANAIEGIAAQHNDGCLVLDELSQVDPQAVQEIFYTLAGGQGKSRANIDGTPRPRTTWSISILSTGELTIEQHARSGGCRIRGGTGVRILDIPADAGADKGVFEETYGHTPAAFSNMLKASAKEVCGAPFREWIEAITTDTPLVTEILKDLARDFQADHCPAGASAEVARAARRFAVIAASGELATRCGITGWDEGDATWGCARCLQDWIAQRGGTGSFDQKKMIDKVRWFLRTYGETDRFPRSGPIPAQTERRTNKGPAGFRKDGFFVFFPDVFEGEVCAGYDPKQVAVALRDAGLLEAPTGRLKKQIDLPGKAGVRYYAVKEAILRDDAEEANH
jgi:putative DNA primase/helicase